MRRYSDLQPEEIFLVHQQMSAGQYNLLTGSGVSLDSQGIDDNMRSVGKLSEALRDINGLSSTKTLQQAYSLLSPEQVRKEITLHYTCKSFGRTINSVGLQRWRRVFTLNVDNCLEVCMRQIIADVGLHTSALQALHFLDDYCHVPPEAMCSIVHLHGSVECPERGYVFSSHEYAKLMTRTNAWMATLTQLIRSEPFIIAGTTLDEIDVEYYLEQRHSGNLRSDIAPSILVEPCPDKLTEQLCDKHELILYEHTTSEFLEQINHDASINPIGFWEITETNIPRDIAALSRGHQLQFLAAFEKVPKDATPDGNAARFLLGSSLSWNMLSAQVDIPRKASNNLKKKIFDTVNKKLSRIFIILGEPGSGKTSVIRRIASDLRQTHSSVFWFTGESAISPEMAAEVFDSSGSKCFIFVDNWADNNAFIKEMLEHTKNRDLIVVGAERDYRKTYVESTISDEPYTIIDHALPFSQPEAGSLIRLHEKEGLSTLGATSDVIVREKSRSISSGPISVAACRIQNNFRTFDRIVTELISEAGEADCRIYVAVAIARYCISSGVNKQILSKATDRYDLSSLEKENHPLPLLSVGRGGRFLVPRRASVADRVLAVITKKNRALVVETFENLAKAIAPYVNIRQIRARSPESKLAARLLDFDQVVKRFINDDAESFYENIKNEWSWNARYWEQVSLLRLDRYLVDLSDTGLLQEAVQHARHAYAIERHPFSLTTLAKLIFTMMSVDQPNRDKYFEEAWELIKSAIKIETGWGRSNLKATAFIVCFNGVRSFVDAGGILSGSQAEDLRDLISTTHQRKLGDRRLVEVRDTVSSIAGMF